MCRIMRDCLIRLRLYPRFGPGEVSEGGVVSVEEPAPAGGAHRARGVVFLDVDGPLNPWAAPATRRPAGYRTHRLRPRGWERSKTGLRVWLHPDHGPMLLRLAESLGFELVWATTWEQDANRLIGPEIGLPELPVVNFCGHPHTLRGWKYPAVLDYADGRPLVWFDDDFGDVGFLHAHSKFMQDREDVPTLLRCVDPRVGLTESDMIMVREWAERRCVCYGSASLVRLSNMDNIVVGDIVRLRGTPPGMCDVEVLAVAPCDGYASGPDAHLGFLVRSEDESIDWICSLDGYVKVRIV